jgi:hypothetical protein
METNDISDESPLGAIPISTQRQMTWTNMPHPEGCNKSLVRASCQLIKSPFNQLMISTMHADEAKYDEMMVSLWITLKGDNRTWLGKAWM